MTIERIDERLCDGCGLCVESCPADVIYLAERQRPWEEGGWVAVIRYRQDCHGCLLCEMDCPQGAIKVSAVLEVPPDWFPYPLPSLV